MIINCNGNTFDFNPSNRDGPILWHDSNPFLVEGSQLYLWMIAPGDLDIVHGYKKGESWTRPQQKMLGKLEILIRKLEQDRDLLEYNYQFSFTEFNPIKRPQSSMVSGFRIDGLTGRIDSYPRCFLNLKLSESAPSGGGRVVRYIDMRNQKSITTEDWGVLRVHRRSADFTLLNHMLEFQHFLQDNPTKNVTISPKWLRT